MRYDVTTMRLPFCDNQSHFVCVVSFLMQSKCQSFNCYRRGSVPAEGKEHLLRKVQSGSGSRPGCKEYHASNWIGAYFESSTTILLIISGMMYYITYILTVTTCCARLKISSYPIRLLSTTGMQNHMSTMHYSPGVKRPICEDNH